MIKPELRREFRRRLRALSEADRDRASVAIRRSLALHPAIKTAGLLAMFDPLPDEPDIAALRADLSRSTRIAYPRRENESLSFYIVASEDQLRTVPGYQFREPDPGRCERVELSEIDTILVPGLAFTPSGRIRLGRGGGFYDRLLSSPRLRARSLGVCFSFQLRPDLPGEDHDQGVDEVVSEKESY